MKRNRFSQAMRHLAGFLCLVLIITFLPALPARAAKTDGTDGKIRISSVDDLLEMSENCNIDEWSRNKTVILTQDLDLSGVDYVPIPVFAGTFNGKNHTIRGLDYSGNGYVAGLFRYIAKDGTVKNLTVEGTISNTDEKECIGGICGENEGLISHCAFNGSISGRSETGGIAGVNASSGIIEDCQSSGEILGYYSTGGIVGKNHGNVVRSYNHADVNNSADWVQSIDENSYDWLSTFDGDGQDGSLRNGTDTGGVAGYSDGVITECANTATIGYAHTGYNIGGIAGRSAGMMTLCENNGRVYGRWDVGGIVGQMEPYVHVQQAKSINDAVEKLHGLIDGMLEDIKSSNRALGDDFESLKSNADDALGTSHDMVGQVSGFVDANMEQIDLTADRLRYVIDSLPAVQDAILEATDALSSVNSDMADISDDLAIMDKMKDTPYSSSGGKRLTLLQGVGGRITSDNQNPAMDSDVTITASPDEGYEVASISASSGGGSIALQSLGGDKYTFRMPAEPVEVRATFRYKGEYVAQSNEGGTVSYAEDQYTLRIKAVPDRGYELKSLTIDGRTVDAALFNSDNELNVMLSDYPANGRRVVVRGTFARQADQGSDNAIPDVAHAITTLSATGGTASARLTASKGDEVILTCRPDEGYRVSYAGCYYDGADHRLTVDGNVASFMMPDTGVRAYAVFEPVTFILTSSTPGGGAKYKVDGDKISLAITPDAGFSLADDPEIYDAAGKKVSISKTKANAYEYEFSLFGLSQPVTGTVSFTGESQYEALQDAVDALGDGAAELSGSMENCKTLIDEIGSIILDSNGKPVVWTSIPASDREKVIKDVVQLSKELSAAGEAAGKMSGSAGTIVNLADKYLADTAENIRTDIGRLTDDLQLVIDRIKDGEAVVKSILDYLSAQEEIQFSGLGDGFDEDADDLYGQLLAISDSMKLIEDDVGDTADLLAKDFQQINEQLNDVFLLLVRKLDEIQNPDVEDYYKDLSDEDIDGTTVGKVQNCKNFGTIEGDTDVGGVAGNMAVDSQHPENNAAGNTQFSIQGIYSTKCVLADCQNYGYVTAKKDNAGCVAGAMSLGVAYRCEAYGRADAGGDYVGGIAGYSDGVIRDCYSLCNLDGASYIGGIAGYADRIEDCYAMVEADTDGTRIGAIAGQAGDADAGQASHAQNNYYVGDELCGIDNISYVGVAEPIAYEELLSTAGLPSKYRHLTVSFLVDGVCIKEYEVEYGEKLSGLEYPDIPQKPGQNGVWPELDVKTMRGNLVVEAEYNDNITVLKSEEASDSKPYALVEGEFTDADVLHVAPGNTGEDAEKQGFTDYQVSLEQAGQSGGDLSIRLLNPYGKKAAAFILASDGTWQPMDQAKIRGEYIQIPMDGRNATYRVGKAGADMSRYIPAIGGGSIAAIILVILLIFFIRRKARKKRNEM